MWYSNDPFGKRKRIKKYISPFRADREKNYYLFLSADIAVITFAFVRFGPFIRLITLFRDSLEQCLAASKSQADEILHIFIFKSFFFVF